MLVEKLQEFFMFNTSNETDFLVLESLISTLFYWSSQNSAW